MDLALECGGLTLSDELVEVLIESARAVRDNAYAPYSGFRVGAAVISESGKIYVGCNVESASYGATLCAERSALAQMIAAGEHRVVTVAVFVGGAEPAMPCGICRQWICELGPHAEIVTATSARVKRTTIDQLMPDPFVLKRGE
jgi:cytidine deaminase